MLDSLVRVSPVRFLPPKLAARRHARRSEQLSVSAPATAHLVAASVARRPLPTRLSLLRMPVLEIVTGLLVTYASSEWLSGSKRRTFSSLLVLATLHAFSAVFGLLSSFEWPRLPMAVRVPL